MYYKKVKMSFFTQHGYFDKKRGKNAGTHIWWIGGSFWFVLNLDDEQRKGYISIHFTRSDDFTNESEEFNHCLALIATTCNYGWLRWWFLDPHNHWKKCSVLYLQHNGYFASHTTLNLAYDTQNQWRWARRAEMESIKAIMLHKSIKYPYRNRRPTRKMKRLLKHLWGDLSVKWYSSDDILRSRYLCYK